MSKQSAPSDALKAPDRSPASGPPTVSAHGNRWIAAGLFLLSFAVFYLSPRSQVGDSHYSMLLSLNLARHGSFQLDRYFQPPSTPVPAPNKLGQDWRVYPNDYSVSVVNGHYYHVYPPGTPVLSAPFVALLDVFGLSPVKADRTTYDRDGEVKIEMLLAALLMAVFTVQCFYLSRTLLPLGWSTLIGFAAAFATPVWSTASRAMWSHTWNVVLTAWVVKLLLDQALRRRALNPWLLATVLSWIYFVRPSNSLMIAAVALYVFWTDRRAFVKFAITGAAWLALFLALSRHLYGTWLPDYYRLYGRMGVSHGYFKALAGLLISPSRGILTYSPILLVVLWLLVRGWRAVSCRSLAWLAIACITSGLLSVAATDFWHGGGSFGPRYSTDNMPWWVLLAVLALNALPSTSKNLFRRDGPSRRLSFGLGLSGLLLAVSVFIHARGAIAYDTAYTWSMKPVAMEVDVGRVWDWRRPQFMEGLTAISRRLANGPEAAVAEKKPVLFPLFRMGSRLDFSRPESDDFLENFSPSDVRQRLSLAKHAEVRFVSDNYPPSQLRIYMAPVLSAGKVDSQAVEVSLNGVQVASFTLREPNARIYIATLPVNNWRPQNVIGFDLPNADSPKHLGLSTDERILGIGVQWLELVEESPASGPPPSRAGSAPAKPAK